MSVAAPFELALSTELTALLHSSGTKSVTWGRGSNVSCSAVLRKRWAQVSYGGAAGPEVDKGLQPMVTLTRAHVISMGCQWPWDSKSDQAAKKVLRTARLALKAGEFNDVDLTVHGPRSKQPMRVGQPPGRSREHAEIEKHLAAWVDSMDGKQVTPCGWNMTSPLLSSPPPLQSSPVLLPPANTLSTTNEH